jgi:hypothetical protein
MRKAKIMLSAIVVFAIVGGALAFKARTGATFYTNTIIEGETVCTLTTHLPFSIAPSFVGQPSTLVTGVYTTALDISCPGTRLYVNL